MNVLRILSLLLFVAGAVHGAVWQWSVPLGGSRARLWIPEDCERVRAVLFVQHNMIERRIMEHPEMRRTLAECGIAEVFVFPSQDPVFDFKKGAGEWFEEAMRNLADESGYSELAEVPVAPMGHSAHASFPWNFAAWNPGRTLAVLSVKGDAPLTGLSGSGRPNPDWGDRSIDGVPGLMVMGEYEWWEKRLEPLVAFKNARPGVPLALFADVGHGHFDAQDELVRYLAMFLRKAAAARLPDDGSNELRAVNPSMGWRVDRWRKNEALRAAAAPFASYEGEEAEAFWCFDEEMARVTEARYETSRGKKEQQVGFFHDGKPVPISNTHFGTALELRPEEDGLSFRLDAGFIAPLPPDPPTATKDERPAVVSKQPEPAPEDSHAAGKVTVSKIVGPVEELGGGRFRLSPDWMFPAAGDEPFEAWFLASNPGDKSYKSAVRQALLRIPRNTEGTAQTITFPVIADPEPGVRGIELKATTDSGLPVSYYVEEGPAIIRGNTLHLTVLPPRTRFPVRVTVAAWQRGRAGKEGARRATPVRREFVITTR